MDGTEPKVKVYGAPWCPDCRRSKQFLGELRVPYEWIDVDQVPEGLEYVKEVNRGKQIIPTIVFEDGSFLAEPSNAELAMKLGISPQAERKYYDLIIVGGGPAGLAAAIYAAREGIDTLVIEESGIGGQAGSTELIDNYPGFSQGVSGSDLASQFQAHAERFGVEILAAQGVAEVFAQGDYRIVRTEGGDEYSSKAVLLATGSTYRKLGVPGEDDLIGAGVHFCATCDGPLYKGQEMLVIGGGNSGLEEGLFLLKFASKVTILEFGDRLRASALLQEKAAGKAPMVEIKLRHTVEAFKGNGKLSSVVVRNLETGEVEEMTPGAVFVFIGLDPNTGFLKGTVELDERGFITTGENLETSMRGVFAAGDVRSGSTKQVASSAGEGANAALRIREFLEETEGSRGYKGD